MSSSTYLKALFWLGVGSWLVILFVTGKVQGFDAAVDLAKPAGTVLTILTIAAAAVEKWIWRWPGIKPHLVKRPHLTGTYAGTIESHWINPETGQRLALIEAYLSISQTFVDITVRLFTLQSSSVSQVGSFIKAPDDCQELLYTYHNEPDINHRDHSPIHFGAARLKVLNKTSRLDGPYWTDRQTIGDMRFRRVSRETCDDFEECRQIAAQPGVNELPDRELKRGGR